MYVRNCLACLLLVVYVNTVSSLEENADIGYGTGHRDKRQTPSFSVGPFQVSGSNTSDSDSDGDVESGRQGQGQSPQQQLLAAAVSTLGKLALESAANNEQLKPYVKGVQVLSSILPRPVVEFKDGRIVLGETTPAGSTFLSGSSGSTPEKSGETSSSNSVSSATATIPPRTCTTPSGKVGKCQDLSSCPALLLDLASLRKSICFRSLFVPGVCCPDSGSSSGNDVNSGLNTNSITSPVRLTTFPPVTTTPRPQTSASQSVNFPADKNPISQIFQTRPPQTTGTNLISQLFQSRPPQPTDPDSKYDFSECGIVQVPSFRVVGGDLSRPGQWPWMAALFLHGPSQTEFWCGGSLISDQYILTAAHCTQDGKQKRFSPRQFTARLGEYNLKGSEPGNPETYQVTEIKVHPSFSGYGFYNDVALFKLDRPVKFSPYIRPICLPSNQQQRSSNYVGEVGTVTGWGTTYYGGRESSLLREVKLPIWRNEDCDKAYFQPITEVFMCAGYADGGKDACQGDSGGPLVLQQQNRWTQIGIVSFGNKCAEPGFPGVYTRITHFLDWIESNKV